MDGITRRALAAGLMAPLATPALAQTQTQAQRLAAAARRQVGVTKEYDPAYVKLAYPGGDVPRATGVCADVVIRAARDGLNLDLQKLVHEDMARAFDAYPNPWKLKGPDANIDHRRVLNLEIYWRRQGAEVWRASRPVRGDAFPRELQAGDILTWRVGSDSPHVGVVIAGGRLPRVVHNIGGGAVQAPMLYFLLDKAHGHYRWPTV
jgi:uncharacterized protein YijF (DUF1287 family)